MNSTKTFAAIGFFGLAAVLGVAAFASVAPASAEPRAIVGRGASDVAVLPPGPYVHGGRGSSDYVLAAVERERVGRGATDQSTMIARATYGTPAVTLAPIAAATDQNG